VLGDFQHLLPGMRNRSFELLDDVADSIFLNGIGFDVW